MLYLAQQIMLLGGKKTKQEFIAENIQNELVIQMEMLPAEEILAENKLVEITDSKVLAHVNNLVPGLAQVGECGPQCSPGSTSQWGGSII